MNERKIYSRILEDQNGYEIIYEDKNTPAHTVFIQPEPYIPYRILNNDGTTNYQASGDLHVKHYIEELNKEDIEKQNNIDIHNRISKLEDSVDKILKALNKMKI